jgi:hypothetical protein
MSLRYLYIDTTMPPVGQSTYQVFVGEFVFLAASLVLIRVGVVCVGDLGARRRRATALVSSLKRRCGLTTGGGLYSSCSTGRRDFLNASSGRLYRGFVNSILFPRLQRSEY